MKTILLALAVSTSGILIGALGFGNAKPKPAAPAESTAAVLAAMSPTTLPDLRLSEYLVGIRADFSERDAAAASPEMARAARLKATASLNMQTK